jgi:hypothetical protein
MKQVYTPVPLTPDEQQAIYETAVRQQFQSLTPPEQSRVLDCVSHRDQLRMLFGPTHQDAAFLRKLHICPE